MPLPHFLLMIVAVIVAAAATLWVSFANGVPLVALALAALIAAASGHAQQSSPQAPPPGPAAEPAPVRAQNGTSAPRPAQTDAQQDGVTRPLSVVALESRANEPAPIRGAGGGAPDMGGMGGMGGMM